MDIDALIARFEAGVMPDGGFHHEQHVQVAWHYLCQAAMPIALERFCVNLKRFAIAQGSPELYHETITTAFVLLINERLDRTVPADWTRFAADHAELLTWKPSILEKYYTPETLWSERAKQTFVMPDRLRAQSNPS